MLWPSPENSVFCWGLEVLSKGPKRPSATLVLCLCCILYESYLHSSTLHMEFGVCFYLIYRTFLTQGFGFVGFTFYILLMVWYGWLGSYPKCSWYNGCSTWGWSSPSCDWHNGSLCSGWRMRLWTSYYGERSWESSLQLLVWAWLKGTYILRLEALFLCSGTSYHPSLQPSPKKRKKEQKRISYYVPKSKCHLPI